MMIPRKTRRMILIVSIIMLLVAIAVTLILLYLNTDMFKSNTTLFFKYLGQNIENMDSFYREAVKDESSELLEQSKYTTEMQAKVNYTENIGTSSESTKNSINQFKLEIAGQTDKSNQYNYQNINLLNNDENVAKIEYIQNKNTYGIKFSDLFSQYILADNENLKELFRKIGYTEEEVESIPDTIDFNNDLKTVFEFSKEERQNLMTKYVSIISSNISKENFSKQKNQIIEINGKKIKANSYILTVTKEQLNNMYIKILEELKQDEIVIAKIDKVQSILEKFQIVEEINLRERFVIQIEDLINNITRSNIGQDEAKLIIYENNQTTIKTVIQHPDHEISIDTLSSGTDNYLQVSYQNVLSKKEKRFTYRRQNEQRSITFNDVTNEKTTQYSLTVEEKRKDNNFIKNTVIKYENDLNRIEVIMKKQTNIVNSFQNEVSLDDENSINLSQLDAEQVQMILDEVNKGVVGKTNEIITNVIKTEDIFNILKAIGIQKEQQTLEVIGITETERSRFNSRFEILQGEDLNSDEILNLIDAIKENLIDLEVMSNTELKLKLDKLNKNEEVTTVLKSFIEENKNEEYSTRVEYDEETGLVSSIILTMLEE